MDRKWQKIRFREITVIVRLLFRPHAVSLALIRIVESSFLADPATRLKDADVTVYFVFQRLPNEPERIDILNLAFGAQLLLASRPHADVGVATQGTFLHVYVAHARIKDDLLQPRKIFVGLVRRGHLGLAYNFNQRHAGTVQID